jgi:NAD(P)-dependent dehydrogenase (short-subunit alcohol dehydrogenase family)
MQPMSWSRRSAPPAAPPSPTRRPCPSNEGAKSIIDDAVAAFGTVHILVNNAGILRDKSFKKMTARADWDIVMDVHLNGTAYVTHAAWPIMYEQKATGASCLTSSVIGHLRQFRPEPTTAQPRWACSGS